MEAKTNVSKRSLAFVERLDEPPIAKTLFGSAKWSWLWLIVRVYLGYQWQHRGPLAHWHLLRIFYRIFRSNGPIFQRLDHRHLRRILHRIFSSDFLAKTPLDLRSTIPLCHGALNPKVSWSTGKLIRGPFVISANS